MGLAARQPGAPAQGASAIPFAVEGIIILSVTTLQKSASLGGEARRAESAASAAERLAAAERQPAGLLGPSGIELEPELDRRMSFLVTELQARRAHPQLPSFGAYLR